MNKIQSPIANQTSWNKVSRWYGNLVSQKGHYFHQNVVMPKSISLLALTSDASVLDLACGPGILARYLPKSVTYAGIDASINLINMAKKMDHNSHHEYFVGDVSKILPVKKNDFTHVTIILALQNIKEAEKVITNANLHLRKNGKLLIILNHPCFRIPRQSSWEIDPHSHLQYRRINRYLTSLPIPIKVHPGKASSPIVWTFHHSLSDYSSYLYKNNFVIEKIEEWTSDKNSRGKAARMENFARNEFPLFLAILAKSTPLRKNSNLF